MIQEKRIVEEFLELIQIDSLSKKEGRFSKVVTEKLKQLGAKVSYDNAGKQIEGDSNNIIAKVAGSQGLPPLMLSAHMDTVTPGENIKPVIKDGVIQSDGSTILGSDDKSGIAVILEVLKVLKERNLSHPPLEVVFTVSEETGLLGAKYLDYSMLEAKYGYALDTGKITETITAAPSHNKIFVKVFGKESHAGTHPEHGISAIEVASQAISKMTLGRIDEETTANIGKINGGTATNIVAAYTEVEGETRSHNEEKLECQTEHMIQCFEEAVRNSGKTIEEQSFSAKIEKEITREYSKFHIPDDDLIVQKVLQAGERIDITIETKKGGGGSDANIFNEKGIRTVLVGSGMHKPHTKEECIKIDDLLLGAKLLLEICKM